MFIRLVYFSIKQHAAFMCWKFAENVGKKLPRSLTLMKLAARNNTQPKIRVAFSSTPDLYAFVPNYSS